MTHGENSRDIVDIRDSLARNRGQLTAFDAVLDDPLAGSDALQEAHFRIGRARRALRRDIRDYAEKYTGPLGMAAFMGWLAGGFGISFMPVAEAAQFGMVGACTLAVYTGWKKVTRAIENRRLARIWPLHCEYSEALAARQDRAELRLKHAPAPWYMRDGARLSLVSVPSASPQFTRVAVSAPEGERQAVVIRPDPGIWGRPRRK